MPGGSHRIRRSTELGSPLMAVLPATWAGPPETPSVGVWCADGGAYRRAVEGLLVLGHERVRVAALADGTSFVLVEDPSWYLVQRWYEEAPGALYWRKDRAGLYLPWGLDHPLGTRVAAADAAEFLYLLGAGGEWRRVPQAGLKDVYASLELELAGRVERVVETVGSLPRVPVRLRWGFRPEPVEPRLWILPAPGHEAIERLLAELPERDLAGLQVAMVEGGAAPLFLVRRLGRGPGSTEAVPVEIPGRGFAAYAGYGSLFLPVDRLLEPPIRKDRYRALLGLKPGETVLLVPVAEDGIEVLRFPERAFRPLPEVVEYRIAAAARELAELRDASVFAFEALELAPRREPLRKGAKDREAGREREPEAGGEEEPAAGKGARSPAPPAPRRAVPREDPEPPPPEPGPTREPGDEAAEPGAPVLDPREAELELAVLERDEPGAWAELAELKWRARRVPEALFAWEEEIWRLPDPEAQARLAALAGRVAALAGIADPAAAGPRLAELATGDAEARTLAARYRALTLAQAPTEADRRRLVPEAYAALRNASLRRKARWLAWSRVLEVARDEAEEERQREEILGGLSRRGLEPPDRPSFLPRYLRQRAGLEAWRDHVEMPALLAGLEAAARTIPSEAIRAQALALVRRTRVEADPTRVDAALLAEIRAAALPGAPTTLLGHAGAALALAGAPEAAGLFRSAVASLRGLGEHNDFERGCRHLLGDLVLAGSFPSAAAVHRAVIEALEAQDPKRRPTLLKKLAPALVELGARAEALRMARAMLASPDVRQDLFLVEAALAALRAALEPEVPERADWEAVGAAIEAGRDRFDALYLDMVEDAAAALGAGFVGRLEAKVAAPPGSYPAMVLATLRLRLGAEQGRAQEGLDEVERSLPVAWGLADPSERCRATCRLVRAVAHFGNAARGAVLLGRVIELVHGAPPGELEDMNRSDLLEEVARASGELGDPTRALAVMRQILAGVEARLSVRNERETRAETAALLAEALSSGIEVLLGLGEWAAAAPLVEAVAAVLQARLREERGPKGGTWYWLRRGRLVCARALVLMGSEAAGRPLLVEAIRELRTASAADRADLLREAARILPLLEGPARREILEEIVGVLQRTEDPSEYDQRSRAELVGELAASVRPGADAYRQEASRWDALEARSIRIKVAGSRPSKGR